jgi:hypothetical protein
LSNYQPQPLRFLPGIQRDGTRLTAPGNYIDGLWTRFSNTGKPKKMGGYRQITAASDGIPRSFENYLKDSEHYIHVGSSANLRRIKVDANGVIDGLPITRTPGAYSMQGDELWQMDVAYDPITANSATIIAHPGRNLADISNSTATSIYIGPATATSALTALNNLPAVSGGICVVHPYLTFFGSDGYFGWSGPNKFNAMAVADGGGEARATSQKIIRGFPIRGGNGPAGLYFSLDSVIRTSFIGGTATWAFDTVSDEVNVVSSRAIAMARNDVIYWMGTDGFFQYDGQVTEIPNSQNQEWVFDSFNCNCMIRRQRCFAFANNRFGEIWFCFPRGNATECTHAAIYNYRLGVWYDTELPNSGRSGGLSSGLYPRPIMGGVEAVGGTYRIWDHEIGKDEVRGTTTVAVRAFIESSDVTLVTAEREPKNATLSCVAVEPDIVQTGEMTLTVTGNANARSPDVDAETITFSPGPAASQDQILRTKVERRQLRFRWESNVAGGDFEIGLPIAHLGPGSGRETG